MSSTYEVACYHWSNWHPYGENDKKRGKGWTEWEYLKQAIPRFPGHQQPKKPLWGYLDDSQPKTAALQIQAAADHGITAFIFDWGWSPDDGYGGHGNNLALEQGFLKAGNRSRLQFGLMLCGTYTGTLFDEMTDYVIQHYFTEPNYWRVEGGLYFSIYELYKFVEAWGSIQAVADAMNRFREKTRAAGLGEIHLAAVEWGIQEAHRTVIGDPAEFIKALGINSVTSYVWAHNTVPKEGLHGPYRQWAEDALALWPEFQRKFPVPYHPHVSVGWDPSPRCPSTMLYEKGGPLMYHTLEGKYEILCQPYFSSIVTDNTPEQFRLALLKARKYLDIQDAALAKIVTLYAWNEWTEGGFLEPEAQYGMAYLEAIRDVFGKMD